MKARLPDRLSHWLALGVALACAATAFALVLHYPLSGRWALAGCLLAGAAAWRWWPETPLPVIAPLPLIGLAPWTGWITFEELDMLVLSVAAGGYAAVALGQAGGAREAAWRRSLALSAGSRLLLGAFALSLLIALARGLADAGGWHFGWWQGYQEPMNSVRAVKSFFLAMLLVPLWLHAGAVRPGELTQSLERAMLLALAGISLIILWERQANTGLLNFSTDYRTTALFWEMHVGGAALDGALAVTMPFAVLALLRARTPLSFAALMALCVAGLYACLTTFSRGVYAAIPVGLVVLLLLRTRQHTRAERVPGLSLAALRAAPTPAKLGALLLAAGFALAAGSMFRSSGYRGLLALLGVMFILLSMPASQWLPTRAQRVVGVLMGALLGAMATVACTAFTLHLPKAAYVSFALAMGVALVLRRLNRPDVVRPVQCCLLSSAWYWMLGCGLLVADSWGGADARAAAWPPVIGLGLIWPVMLVWPQLWPFKTPGLPGWRQRGLLFSAIVAMAALVAILRGGAYMEDRLSTVSEDLGTRLAHWREGVGFLQTPGDWLLGRGAGRYVAIHFFAGDPQDHTGDYRLVDDREGSHLVLTGGSHWLGFGEMFRVTQRVRPPVGDLRVTARVRADRDADLSVDLCEKHLLYPGACVTHSLPVKAIPMAPVPPGQPVPAAPWQEVGADLGPAPAMGGDWWAPRLVGFSMAVGTPGHAIDIDGVRLWDANGDLLSNAHFSNGMARWFFSSDRYHLPWHLKNLGLHVLFEQGIVGVVLFSVLLIAALWRLAFGHARDHALAPALAGALVGFVAVGAFDSLLDVPRLGYLFFVLLIFGLGLRGLPAPPGQR